MPITGPAQARPPPKCHGYSADSERVVAFMRGRRIVRTSIAAQVVGRPTGMPIGRAAAQPTSWRVSSGRSRAPPQRAAARSRRWQRASSVATSRAANTTSPNASISMWPATSSCSRCCHGAGHRLAAGRHPVLAVVFDLGVGLQAGQLVLDPAPRRRGGDRLEHDGGDLRAVGGGEELPHPVAGDLT